MKKFGFVMGKPFMALLALVLVLGSTLAATFAACDSGTPGGEERQPETFSGTSGGATYTLTISPPGSRAVLAGDSYVLTVAEGGVEKTSAGEVTDVDGDAFVLQPSVPTAPPFSLTTSGGGIASIGEVSAIVETWLCISEAFQYRGVLVLNADLTYTLTETNLTTGELMGSGAGTYSMSGNSVTFYSTSGDHTWTLTLNGNSLSGNGLTFIKQ